MVTMGGEAVPLGYAREAAADELRAPNDRVEHREQVSQGTRFVHIAMGAAAERLRHDLQRRFNRHEHQLRVRDDRTYPAGGFDTAYPRQADIEHDHIRSQRLGLTNGVQPVRGFPDDLHVRPLSQQLADHPAERRVVLDDEHPVRTHCRDAISAGAGCGM